MHEEIVGYLPVKEAAKDFATYSSDLQGDRDVRSYRQLPLEIDPPRHTLIRQAVQPLFLSAAIEPKRPEFRELATRLLANAAQVGSADVVNEIALPYVIGCLTIIYNRPQDYDRWLSWGPDVWTAQSHMDALAQPDARIQPKRDGRVLQQYLDEVFDSAEAKKRSGGDIDDVWDNLVHLKVEEVTLTREELQGVANVLLAGGRDTVIKLISALVWHLIEHKDDFKFLQSNQDWFNRTVAELVRFLSPLPKMERLRVREDGTVPSEPEPTDYVLLSFVSANQDKSVWENPDRIDIHRERKPHLAFGFGRHSCMGMNITEHEAASFLEAFLEVCEDWHLESPAEIRWAETIGADGETIRYLDHFENLRVAIPDR